MDENVINSYNISSSPYIAATPINNPSILNTRNVTDSSLKTPQTFKLHSQRLSGNPVSSDTTLPTLTINHNEDYFNTLNKEQNKLKLYGSPKGELKKIIELQRISKEVEELSPINPRQKELCEIKLREYITKNQKQEKELTMDVYINGLRKQSNNAMPLGVHEPSTRNNDNFVT